VQKSGANSPTSPSGIAMEKILVTATNAHRNRMSDTPSNV
jgi:hypothetical protein